MPKKLVEKIYNNGTMTNSAFWGMIRSCLRKRTMFWRPILECKNRNKRKYNGENKRRKWEYKCEKCKKYFDGKQVSVHHKKEAGKLSDFQHLPDFVKNLFCEIDGLILLCNECHAKLHKKK